nr:carbohydrate kinase family protein [Salinibacter ruber]
MRSNARPGSSLHTTPHSPTATDVQTPSLIVVGELNADLIMEGGQARPALEKERVAEGMTLTLGSSSAILASNASAIGMDVGFVGQVGNDAFGDFVHERLKARDVECRFVQSTSEDATGLTVIYTHGDDRGMITYPGAMEALTLEDVPLDYVGQSDHLHLSSFYLQTGLQPDVGTLFRTAKAEGLTTSLDTNWDPDETWDGGILDVLDAVDVFLPNDDEARLIAGEDRLDQAMAALGKRAGAVVVTQGDDGASLYHNGRLQSFSAPQVDPVDAVGAGDSFNAGFLTQYLNGTALPECVEFGLLAGAYSTRGPGGTAAFEDVDGFRSFAASRLE